MKDDEADSVTKRYFSMMSGNFASEMAGEVKEPRELKEPAEGAEGAEAEEPFCITQHPCNMVWELVCVFLIVGTATHRRGDKRAYV